MLKMKALFSFLFISLLSHTACAGEAIYKETCARCHDRHVLQAPARGDELQARLEARGFDGLMDSIIHGRKRMPKKGTCFDCSDDDLRSTLEYMLQP